MFRKNIMKQNIHILCATGGAVAKAQSRTATTQSSRPYAVHGRLFESGHCEL